MKTLAQIMAEDKRIMRHIHRSPAINPEHAKNKRAQELAADGFRLEGRMDNAARNSFTSRSTQAKRGM